MVGKNIYVTQNLILVSDMEDVIVVGGSFAGLSATLTLARSKRKVTVLDSGKPRNRFSSHSHGVVALDGQSGAEILSASRKQMAKYPTVTLVKTEVSCVVKQDDHVTFEVETSAGEKFTSRRLILATGLVDRLPDIPGLKERWGKSAFNCPYCDAYEFGDGPFGLLASSSNSRSIAAQASIHMASWGKTTMFTNGQYRLNEAERSLLGSKGIDLEERIVQSMEGTPDGALECVRLVDGQTVPIKAISVETAVEQAAPFARDLGCEFSDSIAGSIVKTNEGKLTTVPGVYAVGDMASQVQSIPSAAFEGLIAGRNVNISLIDGLS